MSILLELQPSTNRQKWSILFLTIICLLPFVTKAFNVDDPLFLWAAKHIAKTPLDFYGFRANWYGIEMPMYLINQNPPLISYFIALIAGIFQWNEVTLHIAFLIPACALSLGTYYLASFFCSEKFIVPLIVIMCPAFLVSSSTIMTDTAMIAFYVWAAIFWLKGLQCQKDVYLIISAILICFSAFTKYFGITIVPLLLVYTLFAVPKKGYKILYLFIPVFILLGFDWITFEMYGQGLIRGALSYAGSISPDVPRTDHAPILITIIVTFTFIGGGISSVIFLVPALWSKRAIIGAFVLIIILIIVLILMGEIGSLVLIDENGPRWGIVIQFALFFTAGVHILLLAFWDIMHNKDINSLFLLLWIIGTFVFTAFINHMVTIRNIYPMLPAVAMLVARRIEVANTLQKMNGNKGIIISLLPALCLALLVTYSDYSWAASQKYAAKIIREKSTGHRIWFLGHWGFQYYMEQQGGKALNFYNYKLNTGDLLVIPDNNCNTNWFREDILTDLCKIKLKSFSWPATMFKGWGAGFYSANWGPLPYVFYSTPPELYNIYIVGDKSGYLNSP